MEWVTSKADFMRYFERYIFFQFPCKGTSVCRSVFLQLPSTSFLPAQTFPNSTVQTCSKHRSVLEAVVSS